MAMELVPPVLSVEPGHLGCLEVRLTNSGPDACDVSLQVPPAAREWSWVHPESGAVAPGAEAVFGVYFKPTCGPCPSAGTHRVEIMANCRDQPELSVAGESTVEVAPFADVVAVLDPLVGRDQRGVAYALRLENRGNVAMAAALSLEDHSGGALVLGVEPARVAAGPGESAVATVDVQVRKALRKGEQRHRVCVVARVEGGGELRAEGSFYQLGRKGR